MRNPLSRSKSRSLAGIALAAVIAPFLLALTGCLKVPIGNPEKSQIDPTLSGVWVSREIEHGGGAGLWLWEPYDSRTWLVTWIGPETVANTEASGATPLVTPDALTLLEQEDATIHELDVFKAWLAPIGDVRFLVLEPKMAVDAPDAWWTFALVTKGNDVVELRMVNQNLGGLKDVTTSAEAEAIILRNIANPKLLDDEPWVLTRVPAADYERVEDVLKHFNIGN